jgi:signal transduction histidine kinase
LERKNTTLTVTVPETLPLVFANTGELTQVMFNFLQNAQNHTAGGAVTITAESVDGEIIVTVADTGSGVSPEFLPHASAGGERGQEIHSGRTV